MKKRKNHSPDFKAKIALEVIREQMTLADSNHAFDIAPSLLDQDFYPSRQRAFQSPTGQWRDQIKNGPYP